MTNPHEVVNLVRHIACKEQLSDDELISLLSSISPPNLKKELASLLHSIDAITADQLAFIFYLYPSLQSE